jgi:polysaccharide pyruvyl transferase WcaK-like protein
VKILVEPSAHHLLNMGDVAMLTVTARRLRRLWPDASIGILANERDRLLAHCPGVAYVPAAGRRLWFDQPVFGSRLHRALPASLALRLRDAERYLRGTQPRLAAVAVRARRRLKGNETAQLETFLEWATGADLVVVVGAGLVTDAFATAAMTVLELLENAAGRGAATAMMGQGIGPLRDPGLSAAARRVLPTVGLICLREERAGKPILRSLGVREDRVVTTGDDAIELAYEARPKELRGSGLGLSLRVARYSDVDERQVSSVGSVLQRLGHLHGAELLSVPISNYVNERDAEVIARALGSTDGGMEPPETPIGVIGRIQRCRVVVTGGRRLRARPGDSGRRQVPWACRPVRWALFRRDAQRRALCGAARAGGDRGMVGGGGACAEADHRRGAPAAECGSGDGATVGPRRSHLGRAAMISGTVPKAAPNLSARGDEYAFRGHAQLHLGRRA